jgi:hypothetical protein
MKVVSTILAIAIAAAPLTSVAQQRPGGAGGRPAGGGGAASGCRKASANETR